MTRVLRGFCLLLAVQLGSNYVRAGAAVVIQPISATGTHTIVGSDLFLPAGGQRIRLEIRIAGWEGQSLKTVQVALDPEGFDDGVPPIEHASISCPGNNSAGHSFCSQNFENGSRCQVGCSPGSTVGCHCENGSQNTFRSDYVGFGYSQVSAVDTFTPSYRYGMTTQPPDSIPPPAGSYYLGSLFLTVPAGATGTYTVGMKSGETFLYDASPGSSPIPIELRTAARIIIGPPVFPGSRYFTFAPTQSGVRTAVRVTLSSLYHPGPPVAAGERRDFSAIEGEPRWLGPPTTFPDNSPDSDFVAAKLQCAPFFVDWGQFEQVQVYGDAVTPSSVYAIREVDSACEDTPDDPFCFGAPQMAHTGQWGDAVAPFARSDQPAQPDAADISAVVDSYRKVLGAAPKARTNLRGETPDPLSDVNFLDVDLAVDAFKGKPYPYALPSPCP